MSVHISPLVSTVRWYPDGGGFANQSPFDAVCTIEWIGPTEVFLSGLHGKFNKQYWNELKDELVRLGVIKVFAIRHGQYTVLYDHTSKPH